MQSILYKLTFLLLIGLSGTTAGIAQTSETDKDIEAVKAILYRQMEDWNRGDIEAFVKGYWPSDQLKFISQSGVIYGYDNTIARYKNNYPDREAMGKLTFDIKEVKKESRKLITLVGKFTLQRSNDQPTGHFILLFKKIKGEWLIIADCTAG